MISLRNIVVLSSVFILILYCIHYTNRQKKKSKVLSYVRFVNKPKILNNQELYDWEREPVAEIVNSKSPKVDSVDVHVDHACTREEILGRRCTQNFARSMGITHVRFSFCTSIM